MPESLFAKIEFYAANAGEDDPPIRVRRVVGGSGPIALSIGAALHDLESGETLSIEVEQVEIHGEES